MDPIYIPLNRRHFLKYTSLNPWWTHVYLMWVTLMFLIIGFVNFLRIWNGEVINLVGFLCSMVFVVLLTIVFLILFVQLLVLLIIGVIRFEVVFNGQKWRFSNSWVIFNFITVLILRFFCMFSLYVVLRLCTAYLGLPADVADIAIPAI